MQYPISSGTPWTAPCCHGRGWGGGPWWLSWQWCAPSRTSAIRRMLWLQFPWGQWSRTSSVWPALSYTARWPQERVLIQDGGRHVDQFRERFFADQLSFLFSASLSNKAAWRKSKVIKTKFQDSLTNLIRMRNIQFLRGLQHLVHQSTIITIPSSSRNQNISVGSAVPGWTAVFRNTLNCSVLPWSRMGSG